MITVTEKPKNLDDFKLGTLIYDAESGKTPKDNLILIVEPYDTIAEGCFAGVYLRSLRFTDGLSKSYRSWKIFDGAVTIHND